MRKRKKKRTINKKKAIIVFILLITIIYSLFIIFKLIMNPTKTVLIENGDISYEESVIGYIIRNETIFEGDNYKNGMVQIKNEGERLAKGDAIFRYLAADEENINNKIEEIDKKIQQFMLDETSVFSSDIKLLDNQIKEKLEISYKLNDVQKIKENKKAINTYITKKAKIIGGLSDNQSEIKKLLLEREGYEKQLNNSSEYIYSTESGMVSYRIDGLENVLTVEDFNYLNKDFLESLKLRTSQIIATNTEKVKVIDNFRNYIVCVLDSDGAKNAKVDDELKVRLPNSKKIKAKVVHVSKQNSDETLLVFEINTGIEEIMKYRKISFDIIWWSNNGLKVPNSAIFYDNDRPYVIRKRAGYEEKVIIKILGQNDKYSIVDNYSSEEIQELGYNMSEYTNKKSVSLYDELKISD